MIKNKAIEGARGILILFIILYHYTSKYPSYGHESFVWDDGLLIGKDIGNCGFLIISGYLYFKSICNISSITPPHEVFGIVCKKIKRLYIPYAVAIIFMGLASCFITFLNQPKWIDYVSNLLLIRSFLKVPFVDGAHWYFYAMIQLNILLPLIILTFKKRSIFYAIIAIAFYSFITSMNAFAIPKVYLLCFLAGASLTMDEKKISTVLYTISVLTVTYFTGTYSLIFVFILMPIICLKPENSYLDIFFGNRIIVFVGTYSYMWYLIHQQFGYTICHSLKGQINDYYIVVITAVITFLFAILLQKATNMIINYAKIK